MTLSDYQYSYGGLVIGDGTSYELVEVRGIDGFGARVGDRPLPRGHGSVPGKHYANERQVSLTIEVGSSGDVESSLAALLEAFAIEEDNPQPLTFKHPNRPERFINCRPIQASRTLDVRGTFLAPLGVELLAADPRIYGTTERMVSVPLYTPSGGSVNYPLANYPKNFAAGAALEAVATNNGAADAYPLVRFYGPTSGTCTGITLTNLTTGVIVDIDTTILVNQILTADFGELVTGGGGHIISLDGASRYGSWQQTRTPLAFPPGDSTLRFQIDGTSTNVRCVVSWHDTWLA